MRLDLLHRSSINGKSSSLKQVSRDKPNSAEICLLSALSNTAFLAHCPFWLLLMILHTCVPALQENAPF